MGMDYQFYYAEKDKEPKEHPNNNTAGWTPVGPNLAREDFLNFLLSEGAQRAGRNVASPYSYDAVRCAIEILEELDRDVLAAWNLHDLTKEFRKRIVKGLVSTVYGSREYHYVYPPGYYPEGDWRSSPDALPDGERGSFKIRSALKPVKDLLETGKYVVRLAMF